MQIRPRKHKEHQIQISPFNRLLVLVICVISGLSLLAIGLTVKTATAADLDRIAAASQNPVTKSLLLAPQPVSGHWPDRCNACHVFQYQCAACHQETRPRAHYSGDCSLCHSPGSWKFTQIDHKQPEFVDCQLCHASIRPKEHFAVQCSTCHTPDQNWQSVTFSHDQLARPVVCATCHESARPSAHYSGDCSTCHTPLAWKPAHFDHQGAADCQSCHEKLRPAGHFTGQCSQCHTPGKWLEITFDHTGQTDCQSCHLKVKPAAHFAGQCSQCHTPGSWKNARFKP
jgi:hypothetical protein